MLDLEAIFAPEEINTVRTLPGKTEDDAFPSVAVDQRSEVATAAVEPTADEPVIGGLDSFAAFDDQTELPADYFTVEMPKVGERAHVSVTDIACRRCGSTSYRDVPIHGGESIRRECGRCGRFIDFPLWYRTDRSLLGKAVPPAD